MNYKSIIILVVLIIIIYICSTIHHTQIEHIRSNYSDNYLYNVDPEKSSIKILKSNYRKNATASRETENMRRKRLDNSFGQKRSNFAELTQRLIGSWKDDNGLLYTIVKINDYVISDINNTCAKFDGGQCYNLKGQGNKCIRCIRTHEPDFINAKCFKVGDNNSTMSYVSKFCDESIKLTIKSNINKVYDIKYDTHDFKNLIQLDDTKLTKEGKQLTNEDIKYSSYFNGIVTNKGLSGKTTIQFENMRKAHLCTPGELITSNTCSAYKNRKNFNDSDQDMIIWDNIEKTKWYKILPQKDYFDDYNFNIGYSYTDDINKLGSKHNIINYDMGEKCANTCSKNNLCKAFINDTRNKSCIFYDISHNINDIQKVKRNTISNLYVKKTQ